MNDRTGTTRPNFLFIGTAKAGSSWIHEILREHPEIFVPPAKDLHFFDKCFGNGMGWYLDFFKKAQTARAIGEISHDYLTSPEAPVRIKDSLPGAKLFCCLREPIDKTVSAYVYARSIVLDRRMSMESYAMSPELIAHNDYLTGLANYYRIFPRESILVTFYDELKQDPGSFARRIYSFLGVDPSFVPPSLGSVVLPAREPRNYFLSHLAYRVGLLFRKAGRPNIVGRVKQNRLFEFLLYRPIRRKPDCSPDLRQKLRDRFKPDYEKLAQLIGRELPDAWLRA